VAYCETRACDAVVYQLRSVILTLEAVAQSSASKPKQMQCSGTTRRLGHKLFLRIYGRRYGTSNVRLRCLTSCTATGLASGPAHRPASGCLFPHCIRAYPERSLNLKSLEITTPNRSTTASIASAVVFCMDHKRQGEDGC